MGDAADQPERLARDANGMLVFNPPPLFFEPQTSATFDFRKHKVTRTGFTISHGRVVTSTACQGRTMRQGVIIDAGCKEEDDLDSLWLHLYVSS